MKILYAAETIKGGIASVIRVLFWGFADSNEYEIKCLIPDSQVDDLPDIPFLAIKKFGYDHRGFVSSLRFSWALLKLTLAYRPDVVHLHSTFAGVLGRIVLLLVRPIHRCKVVYSPHAFAFTMQIPCWKKNIYTLIEKALIGFTDQVVCTCQYELDVAVEHGLDRRKLILIHNGVPVPTTLPSLPAIESTGCLTLLFVGRFDYQKGFDLLRGAMDLLTGEPVRLIAIGAAVHASHAPPPHPQIEYQGWVGHAQLPEFYRKSHILVMPSRWEGFAMTPLEALSYGLPVLASSHGSFDEVVIPGVSGDRFPTNNVQALVDKIRLLTPAVCLSMRESAYQHFLKNFKDSQMVMAMEILYRGNEDILPGVLE